jgi:hypothetical protein
MAEARCATAVVRVGWRAALVSLLVALGTLGGCTAQTKLREAELTQLLSWLPGTYESVPRTEHDAAAGGQWSPHERVALVIVRVFAPRLGHHALYAQEMAADDPRRVMSERMFSFKVDENRGIVETVYTFVEPLRWRDGQNNVVLFSSAQPDDVRSVPGCELVWKKGAGRFTAAADPERCPASGAAASGLGGTPAAELTAEFFTFGGYQFRRTR